MPARRSGLRCRYASLGTSRRPLRCRRHRRRSCRNLSSVRLKGGQRPPRQCRAGWRRRRSLLFPKLLLGRQRRHRRPLLWLGVGLHEHGRASRWSSYRVAHSMDCCPLRLDRVFYGCGRALRSGRNWMVSREPEFEQYLHISGRNIGMKLKLTFAFLAVALSCEQAAQPQSKEEAATIHVDTTPGHELNTFDPDIALGSSIDALSHFSIDKVYTPHIIQESLGAGWGPISYRNNTELRMAAWHWTENGTWSDAEGKRGYFTGSTELKEPIRYILPYALPHRGFSTSGDRPITGPNLTYWKSNPYLTSKFTGESDALHPQWVVIDLNRKKP